jgi:formyl-CoA transferase
MEEAGIPCGPINTIDQVFADPQVRHLDMAKPVQHGRLGPQRIVGSAINMQGLDDSPRSATAEAGADTDAILASLGRTPEQIAELRARRVI